MGMNARLADMGGGARSALARLLDELPPDDDGARLFHAAAPPLDPATRQAAELALEEHWALRSLRRERREQILAVAVGAAPTTTAPPLPRVRRGRRTITPAELALAAADRVTIADVVHLAGAYDLAGRDAIALLDALDAGDAPAALPALGERRTLRRDGVAAQLVVAAARAFTLHAALPVQVEGAAAAGPADPGAAAPDAGGGGEGGGDAGDAGDAGDGPRPPAEPADADPRADESLLHRLLHLAALAEIGRRRADWLRWLAARAPALAARPCAAPLLAAPVPDAPVDAACPWDVRYRALVVAAWVAVLPRSGPSGLDDAMELLARLREERAVREEAWLDGLARDHGEAAVMRARFTLFALGHLADAAVETLLFLRHGETYADPRTVDHIVDVRLRLAREAAAGDLQWDALLVWLREAVRLVIARRSPQLEMAVGE